MAATVTHVRIARAQRALGVAIFFLALSCAGSVRHEGAGAAGADAGATSAICSSATYWTSGSPPSELMSPGEACMSCHAGGSATVFSFAGTVYRTPHEPNDCSGTNASTSHGPISVILSDTDRVEEVSVSVNDVGNFFYRGPIRSPYLVTILDVTSGTQRAMLTAATSGDCNSCHGEPGAADAGLPLAPGRIVAP